MFRSHLKQASAAQQAQLHQAGDTVFDHHPLAILLAKVIGALEIPGGLQPLFLRVPGDKPAPAALVPETTLRETQTASLLPAPHPELSRTPTQVQGLGAWPSGPQTRSWVCKSRARANKLGDTLGRPLSGQDSSAKSSSRNSSRPCWAKNP